MYNVDEYARRLREETNRMLKTIEPLSHFMVHDLPPEPEEGAMYHLEQTWVYVEGEGWIRMT